MGRQHIITPRLILGLGIIVVGVLMTLETLGLVDTQAIFEWWPLVPILIGLTKIFLVRGGAVVSGLIWLSVGTLFLLNKLDVLEVSPWDLWPLILVLIGGNLVRRALFPGRSKGDAPSDTLSGFAMFTGQGQRSTSQDFRGGDFTALMGGCDVDLSEADIQGEAIVDVFAFWGGIDLTVPSEWNVQSEVSCLAGGFEDDTGGGTDKDPNKTLRLRGMAIMGGVRIANESRRRRRRH